MQTKSKDKLKISHKIKGRNRCKRQNRMEIKINSV